MASTIINRQERLEYAKKMIIEYIENNTDEEIEECGDDAIIALNKESYKNDDWRDLVTFDMCMGYIMYADESEFESAGI